jgi:hypothetical protein
MTLLIGEVLGAAVGAAHLSCNRSKCGSRRVAGLAALLAEADVVRRRGSAEDWGSTALSLEADTNRAMAKIGTCL